MQLSKTVYVSPVSILVLDEVCKSGSSSLQGPSQNTFVPQDPGNLQDNLSIKHFMISENIERCHNLFHLGILNLDHRKHSIYFSLIKCLLNELAIIEVKSALTLLRFHSKRAFKASPDSVLA